MMNMAEGDSLKLDTRSSFDRAVEALLALIETDRYGPGDKLPSEEALAQQLGISRSTLREAIRSLESRGVIVRRRGIGTFIAALAPGHFQGGLEHLESVRSLAALQGHTFERLEWEVSLVQATEILAETLEKNPGDTLIRSEMIAAFDNEVFAYMDGFTPNRLVDVDDLRAFERGSLLDYLTEEGLLNLSYTRTAVFAVQADERVGPRLGVPQGTALLKLREVYHLDSGQPVVLYENYFVTNVFNFHIYRRVLK